jgi:hypothetical protein
MKVLKHGANATRRERIVGAYRETRKAKPILEIGGTGGAAVNGIFDDCGAARNGLPVLELYDASGKVIWSMQMGVHRVTK